LYAVSVTQVKQAITKLVDRGALAWERVRHLRSYRDRTNALAVVVPTSCQGASICPAPRWSWGFLWRDHRPIMRSDHRQPGSWSRVRGVSRLMTGEFTMPDILPFSPTLLDDTATKLVGRAYDAACKGIGNVSRNARMAIADRTIDAALRREKGLCSAVDRAGGSVSKAMTTVTRCWLFGDRPCAIRLEAGLKPRLRRRPMTQINNHQRRLKRA